LKRDGNRDEDVIGEESREGIERVVRDMISGGEGFRKF
jgi:hypothetical protein